jgi:hypothetical protein
MGGYYLPNGATTASLTTYNTTWDDYLEDREATVGKYPTTTEDMTRLFEWKHGDEVYGDFAKDNVGMNSYIDDINRAWGRQDDYDSNKIYVDTFKPEVGKRYKQGGDL